jgi:F0F1-type ATP synthase membrane subunit b/b'
MDTKSRGCVATLVAIKPCCVLLVAAMLCAGCKSPPVNPFLARRDREKVAEDETAADAARDLASEVQAAFNATAAQAKQAASDTLADAADRGREVGAHAVDSAQAVARDASTTVQVQAIESMAAWPIEQAGPMLLLAIAEGGPAARRAAAKQLSERWPPAADFPVDAVAERRATALQELRNMWVVQYGEINDAVVAAKARAQQVIGDTQQVVSDVQQVSHEVREVARTAADGVRAAQEAAAALRQANLPEVARRQATATLEQLAQDANLEVRMRVARTIGELADPAFLPVLMGMLADQVEVQREALASLALVVGGDVAAGPDGASFSTDEKIHRWQLWYQEHPQQHSTRR